MRIIETNDEIIITCSDCNSVLGVAIKDVCQFDHDTFIICLKCNAQMSIRFDQLPDRWQHELVFCKH